MKNRVNYSKIDPEITEILKQKFRQQKINLRELSILINALEGVNFQNKKIKREENEKKNNVYFDYNFIKAKICNQNNGFGNTFESLEFIMKIERIIGKKNVESMSEVKIKMIFVEIFRDFI